jgi:predicted kinase
MTVGEAYSLVKSKRPQFVHVTGKTCTGKTTFANHLKNELGYAVIELDELATEAVIEPLGLAVKRGHAMFELYKERNELQWIGMLVSSAHQKIQNHIKAGQPVVLDGAVSNLTTLQELLKPFPDTETIYFHPVNPNNYIRFITERFMRTAADYHAGLPVTFWELVDKTEFQRFCQTRIITPGLARSIKTYAMSSMRSSTERLKKFQKVFRDIKLVEV